MTKAFLNPEKTKQLVGLLDLYKQEITAIYAIGVTWEQLKDEAKDKCAEDFDKALVARETLLEELLEIKNMGIKVVAYELELKGIDQVLLSHSSLVKDIYGFNVFDYIKK